jgi:hypothetical protein
VDKISLFDIASALVPEEKKRAIVILK